MPKNIWENHFGIRVNKKKCPISRCGSNMEKSLYCDQKNHKQSGAWEIKREYPESMQPEGIMIDQYEKRSKPVCCNCNEKSSNKKINKDQPSPIHNKFSKKVTSQKSKSTHKKVNTHHSSPKSNHNQTIQKIHHKKEQPIQRYEYIVPKTQNNSQFNNSQFNNNQANYKQQNGNSNFNNNNHNYNNNNNHNNNGS